MNHRKDQEDLRHNAVQLAVYRLAWAATRGVPPESVRAAFHYVRSGSPSDPDVLPDADELGRAARRAVTLARSEGRCGRL